MAKKGKAESAEAEQDGNWLELLDWRRQSAAVYESVRLLRADNMVPAHSAWLEGRDRLFRDHPQSPLSPERRKTFHRLRAWPYNPAFAFTAAFQPRPEETFAGPMSVSGAHVQLVRIGAVELLIGTLDVYWIDDYAGGLFLPFTDKTNGAQTYGGGRYLLDTAKGADLGSTPSGELMLDFNFAYQPSCAWDARWACPLAPPNNRLDVAVEAGEQLV